MFRFKKKNSVSDFLYLSLEKKVDLYYDMFILDWEENFASIKKNRKTIKGLIFNELDAWHFSNGILQIKRDKTVLGERKLNSELGHLTGVWNIDWAWIVHHIALDYKNQIIAINNVDLNKIGRIKFYKYVPKKYYEFAERIYLKDTSSREPRLFDFDELFNNGSGIKKIPKDFKPVIGITLWGGFDNEFWDMTELKTIKNDLQWNVDKKMFELDMNYKRKINRKSKIIIRYGDSKTEI